QGSTEGNLLVGETATYTATYQINQSDVDSGGITNSVVAIGLSPANTAVSDISDNGNDTDGNTTDDSTVFTFTSAPEIALIKTAEVANSGLAGDLITYTFTVTNIGNVSLSNIVIDDILTNTIALTLAPSTLAPGETGSAMAFYIIEEADIATGNVTNSALVKGNGPDGTEVGDISGTEINNDEATITVVPNRAPEAINDNARTNIGQTVTIHILDNDLAHGIDFVPESLEIIDGPNYGTLRIDSDGRVVYIPSPGTKFTGQEIFTYRVQDANGIWTNVATVTIDISGLFLPNAISPN